MPVIAKLRYLRIAPRKVRLVADLIRKKSVEEAQNILNFTQKRTALPLLKLLKSAIANARHNFGLEEPNLYISKITVDEGPKLKRWMPRARGQTSEIQKKTSHVTLILDYYPPTTRGARAEREGGGRVGVPRKRGPEIEKVPEKIKEIKKEKLPEKVIKKISKPKIPKPEVKVKKPKIERAVRRVFGRKAF